MSTIERATLLIEVLAGDVGHCRTVGELSAETGIPAPTCTRLLKHLTLLGWVDQAGNRAGYRFGPRAYALTSSGPYRERLLDVAVPAMRTLAASWPQAGVVLVVLRSWGQEILWECGASQGQRGQWRFVRQEPWHGPCGRILVAYMPTAQRQRWINRSGLPSPFQWPGILTRGELLEELAEIRRDGVCECEQAPDGLYAAAVAVRDEVGRHVSIGMYQPMNIPKEGMLADLKDVGQSWGMPEL